MTWLEFLARQPIMEDSVKEVTLRKRVVRQQESRAAKAAKELNNARANRRRHNARELDETDE